MTGCGDSILIGCCHNVFFFSPVAHLFQPVRVRKSERRWEIMSAGFHFWLTAGGCSFTASGRPAGHIHSGRDLTDELLLCVCVCIGVSVYTYRLMYKHLCVCVCVCVYVSVYCILICKLYERILKMSLKESCYLYSGLCAEAVFITVFCGVSCGI